MNTLCRIREVSRAIAEFEQCFEREYRLSMNEGVLLCCLARHGELSSGEIAEMLRLTCSNTSKVIRSVEGKGFVIRKLGEEDKRQMYFSLTEAGRAELERLQPCRVALPELLARVETVLRRCGKAERLLTLEPDIEIDPAARIVRKNGSPVALTAKEFDLLLLFAQNRNIVLCRDRIYERVWNEEYLGDSRTVDLHIQRMRKKLGLEDRLTAVYKVGYRLEG